MRPFFLTLLLSLAASAMMNVPRIDAQDSTGTHFPPDWGLELRVGMTELHFSTALELQKLIIPWLSFDIGFSPTPFSGYAGLTAYPIRPFMLQVHAGIPDWSYTEGTDAPVLEPSYFYGWRAGILAGGRHVAFSVSGGMKFFYDTRYCFNCGGIPPPGFEPEYGTKLYKTFTVEVGVRSWPF